MQQELFDPEHYPKNQFKPLHDVFRGKALVARHAFSDEEPFEVTLDKGNCSCKHGAAYVWYSDRDTPGKWITNRYCVHKLKAMADIVQRHGAEQNPEIMFAFMKAVATRYNRYEVVSTFHKYLRIGKVDMAYFFGCILATTRATKGVIRYLLNIVYEETRDHALRRYLTSLLEQDEQLTFVDMARAITWFCETKKKWDLHDIRVPLFYHEMRGYQRLVKEFGVDVAKAAEIIDADMLPVFLAGIPKAIKKRDWDALQYCVKGIQKTKLPKEHKTLHDMRKRMAAELYLGAKASTPPVRMKAITRFYKYLQAKPARNGISYHDINTFADLIAGEPAGYGNLPKARREEILRIERMPEFPFQKFPSIPLFAKDNHVWAGKALLRIHAGQIPFGVEQSEIDLRGCGAYHGVNWRYHAAQQHGTIKVKWHEVTAPVWVRNLTVKLFY